MKNFTCFSLLFCVAALHAQELAPTLITPAGGYTQSAQGSLSWSLGEVAVESVSQNASTLSQGFQQIEIDTNTIALPDDPQKIKLLIPNVITPFEDGANDLFDPLGALQEAKINVSEQQADLTIVNRWGEVVFIATNPYRPWDGRSSQGATMPQATYYFVLTIHRSKDITIKGAVNLVR